MNRFVIPYSFSFLFLISCTNQATTSQDLSNLDIGKNQTAILGRIISISERDKAISLNIQVVESRQGGAGSPAIPKEAKIEAICTPIFIRAYNDRTGSEVKSDLAINQEVIVFLSKSIKYQNYIINHINAISK